MMLHSLFRNAAMIAALMIAASATNLTAAENGGGGEGAAAVQERPLFYDLRPRAGFTEDPDSEDEISISGKSPYHPFIDKLADLGFWSLGYNLTLSLSVAEDKAVKWHFRKEDYFASALDIESSSVGVKAWRPFGVTACIIDKGSSTGNCIKRWVDPAGIINELKTGAEKWPE